MDINDNLEKPYFIRFVGMKQHDPLPITIVRVIMDAMGRPIELIDRDGVRYPWTSIISYRACGWDFDNG
mgnify:CR=1 FL=1